MTAKTSYTPGTFCWNELMTTNAVGAKAFYSGLFAWTTFDVPTGHGDYTMLRLEGREAAALCEIPGEMQKAGVPSHWGSYIAVESVDETSARAVKLGAKLVMPAMDVMDAGRMAMLEDPTGAKFSLWEARKHFGAQVVEEPGSLCWMELATADPQRAIGFYGELLNWKAAESPGYTQFGVGPEGQHFAGMRSLAEPGNEGIPPHWMPYFAVKSCAESTTKARELGAKVIVGSTLIPNTGTFSLLQDPQGAMISIFEFLPK